MDEKSKETETKSWARRASKVLEATRRLKDMTYMELGDHTGFSTSKVWRILNNNGNSKREDVRKVAKALGVSWDELAQAMNQGIDAHTLNLAVSALNLSVGFKDGRITKILRKTNVVGVITLSGPFMLTPHEAISVYEMGNYDGIDVYLIGPPGQDVTPLTDLFELITEGGGLFH
jgi:transcriptional regulator with XRE-family HTH domain